MQAGLSRLATPALVAAVAVMAAACASLSGGAKTEFATGYFCPPDRITVAERPDLKHPTTAHVEIPLLPPPPAEVQADPQRLAMYNEAAKKRREVVESLGGTVDNPLTYYEVHGCGHHVVYGCWHGRNRVQCSVLHEEGLGRVEAWSKSVCACTDAACVNTLWDKNPAATESIAGRPFRDRYDEFRERAEACKKRVTPADPHLAPVHDTPPVYDTAPVYGTVASTGGMLGAWSKAANFCSSGVNTTAAFGTTTIVSFGQRGPGGGFVPNDYRLDTGAINGRIVRVAVMTSEPYREVELRPQACARFEVQQHPAPDGTLGADVELDCNTGDGERVMASIHAASCR
jgi:hypothetical protein